MIEPVDQTSVVVEIETVVANDQADTVKFATQEEELKEVEELLTAPASLIAAETESTVNSDRSVYRLADLSAFKVDPDSFFEFSYRPTLMAMVQAVMDAEAPMREDVLAQRIACAHGWLRTGSRIRERIALHLKDFDRTEESSGSFLWKKDTVTEVYLYRAGDGDARRSVFDTPLSELSAIIISNPDLLDETDPALSMARVMGVERLAGTSRARLEEAIARAQAHLG